MWLKIYTSEPGPLVSRTLKSADWREAESRAMTKSSLLWEAIRWFIGAICRVSCKRMGLTHTIHEEMFSIYQHRDRQIAIYEVDGNFFSRFFIQRVRTHHPQHWWQDLFSNIDQAKQRAKSRQQDSLRGSVGIDQSRDSSKIKTGRWILKLGCLLWILDWKKENWEFKASIYLYHAL